MHSRDNVAANVEAVGRLSHMRAESASKSRSSCSKFMTSIGSLVP